MYNKPHTPDTKVEGRLQAVLALLRGEPATRVAEIFGLCRSALYRLRQRALIALRAALADQRRGPKVPHNTLPAEKAAEVVELCQRHPTWSSYQLHRHLGSSTPCARTIQRLRRRCGLLRLPKRVPARAHTKRFLQGDMQQVLRVLHARPYLGAERLSWDIHNQAGVAISPATIKRYRRWLREWLLPPAVPRIWRFYERHHTHSLWHGDCLEKVTLTDLNQTAYRSPKSFVDRANTSGI